MKFIILTCEKYINTRLNWQLKTSLKEIPKKDIYAISCKMGKESYIYGWDTEDDYDSLAMKYYMFIKSGPDSKCQRLNEKYFQLLY